MALVCACTSKCYSVTVVSHDKFLKASSKGLGSGLRTDVLSATFCMFLHEIAAHSMLCAKCYVQLTGDDLVATL